MSAPLSSSKSIHVTTPSLRELTDPNAVANVEADNQPSLCRGALPCVPVSCPWCLFPSAKSACAPFHAHAAPMADRGTGALLLKPVLGLLSRYEEHFTNHKKRFLFIYPYPHITYIFNTSLAFMHISHNIFSSK